MSFIKKNNNYRFYFWLAAFGGLLFYIRSVLLPFILGILIAYLFKDMVDKYENKISRQNMSIVVCGFCLLAISIIMFIGLPIFCNQFIELIKFLINSLKHINLQDSIKIFSSKFYENGIDIEEINNFIENLSQYIYENCLQYLGNISNYIVAYSVKIINVISMIFLGPIFGFYFLRDWNKILTTIKRIIPTNIRGNATEICKKIDNAMHNYFISQLIICGICCVYYSIALHLTGLKYGFIIGLLTGITTCIPYVGAILCTTIGIVVCLMQYGFNFYHLFIVGLVFFIGIFTEGNFITPRILGDKMNIHPLWILFSLFVGGKLFGFCGMLLAVPVTGVIDVIIRFYLNKRKGFLCLLKTQKDQ